MNCQNQKEKIYSYAYENITDPTTEKKIEEHLNTCDECWDYYADLLEFRKDLEDSFIEYPDEVIEPAIIKKLRKKMVSAANKQKFLEALEYCQEIFRVSSTLPEGKQIQEKYKKSIEFFEGEIRSEEIHKINEQGSIAEKKRRYTEALWYYNKAYKMMTSDREYPPEIDRELRSLVTRIIRIKLGIDDEPKTKKDVVKEKIKKARKKIFGTTDKDVRDTFGKSAWLISGLKFKEKAIETLEEAEKYYAEKNVEYAELLCKAVLEVFPEHPGALSFLGMIYLYNERPLEARPILEKAFKKIPDDVDLLVDLGRLYKELELEEQAEIVLGKAKEKLEKQLSFEPDSFKTKYNLAIIYYFLKEYKSELQILEELNKKYPEILGICNNLSLIYSDQNEFEKAEQLLTTILDKYPDNKYILNNLGVLYNETNKLKKSKSLLERANDLYPLSYSICNNLANTYYDLGEIDNAKHYIEQACRIFPSDQKLKKNREIIFGLRQGSLIPLPLSAGKIKITEH